MKGEPITTHECVPTVHLNGTSGADLVEGYRLAHEAASKALDALHLHAAPNARDFYPQGAGAFQFAQREHERRADALRSVMDDMQALAERVQQAIDERDSRRDSR